VNKRSRKNVQKNEINEERAVQDERMHTLVIEGRNAVLEAFRSGKPIDKVFVLDGCQDGPVRTIVREAKKHDTILNFVGKDRLNQISQTGRHQGVIAYAAAYDYAKICLHWLKNEGKIRFLYCWIILRIHII
jgi:23S rRNA (guanosine2251-2'-O)-methyltransferase